MAKKLKVLATANGKKPPVGRMIPATGVRINRDGTIDVMGSGKSKPNPKKRRATKKNRPKVTKKRPANPSVRKSKKTFRKYAKRLGVALPKRLPRKLTHSKANKKKLNPKTEYVVGGTPYSTLAKAKTAAKRESKSEGRAYVENASTGKTLARYEYGRQVR